MTSDIQRETPQRDSGPENSQDVLSRENTKTDRADFFKSVEDPNSKQTKKRFAKNVGSGWLVVLANTLVGVFILPLNLHYLGKDVYAISVLATSILTILRYIDFGVTPTLLRFFSKAIASQDQEEFQRLSSTTKALTTSLGIAGAGLFLACFPWFCSNYNISSDQKTATFLLFCSMAFQFAESFFLVPYSAVLQGGQRLDLLNLTRTCSIVLRVVGFWFFYQFCWRSLVSMAIVITLEALFRIVVLTCLVRRQLGSAFNFSFHNVSFSLRRDGLLCSIFSFSYLAFLNTVSMGLSINLPGLIIGKEMGKPAVADFAPALMATSFLTHILGAVTVPLTPLASLDRQQGGKNLGVWSIKVGQIVACLGCLALTTLLLFGGDWLTVWLGPDFAWTCPIVVILAGFTILAAVQGVNFYLALGAGSIAPVAVSALVMAVLVTVGVYTGLHFRHAFWEVFTDYNYFHWSSSFVGLLGVASIIGLIRFGRNVVYLTYRYSKEFGYSFWKYQYCVYLKPFAAFVAIALIWRYSFGFLDWKGWEESLTLCQHDVMAYLNGVLNLGESSFDGESSRLALLLITLLKTGVASCLYGLLCVLFVIPKDVRASLGAILKRKIARK